MLDLLDAGLLTKGHGKSLLREPDAERRRELARRAVDDGWSVRQLERAIAARSPAMNVTFEQVTAQNDVAERLAERLRGCVGDGVKVRSRGKGFAIQIVVASLADAESIVARLADRSCGAPSAEGLASSA